MADRRASEGETRKSEGETRKSEAGRALGLAEPIQHERAVEKPEVSEKEDNDIPLPLPHTTRSAKDSQREAKFSSYSQGSITRASKALIAQLRGKSEDEETEKLISTKKPKKGASANISPKVIQKAAEITEHLKNTEELAKSLRSQVHREKPSRSGGLSQAAAEEALEKFGPNSITPPKPKPFIIKFLECLANLFNILLVAAGGGNIVMYLLNTDENTVNFYIGIILMVVSILNAGIELYELHKISTILKSFSSMVEPSATIQRDGKKQSVRTEDLVPGDVLHLGFGDKVPADCVLFWASDFRVDNSSITGESDPQERLSTVSEAGTLPLDAVNLVFSGTVVISGEAYGIVIRTGDQTVIGQIAGLTKIGKKRKSPLTDEIQRFCKMISVLASMTAIVFFVACLAQGRSFDYALQFAIGILVAWIPQGLPVTVTMLLTIAGRRMAEQKVLVKDLTGVETLGSITMLATDKTGTLTKNQMEVANIWTNNYMWYAGSGGANDCPLGERILKMDASGIVPMLHIVSTCTRAKYRSATKSNEETVEVGDATDLGLLRYAASRLLNFNKLKDLYPKMFEIPFSSDTKMHLSIHRKSHKEGGLTLFVKGAPERVLAICSHILIDNKSIPLDEKYKSSFDAAYLHMASKGHRVLACAQLLLPGIKYPDNYIFCNEKRNWPMDSLCFVGLISLEDPPKHGVREAIGQMRTAGIKVVMITGDHPLTAETIGRRINLVTGDTRESLAKERGCSVREIDDSEYDSIVVHGQDIRNFDDHQWEKIFSKDEIIFARTSPQQKLEIVTRAQALGHIVGVTGDGVNDASALKKADLGIAMNKTGSDISKEVSGMILLDDNFASIVTGIREGRLIFMNLKKCITYSLTHIMPEVIPYLVYVLVPLPLALMAPQILAVDLGFEIFTSLSFAWEVPENPEILMKMAPRRPVSTLCSASTVYEGHHDIENPDDDDRVDANAKLQSRWRGYVEEAREILTKPRYHMDALREWMEILRKPTGERLVDLEVLCWSYVEGGFLECGGAFLAYALVFYEYFGISLHDARVAQKTGMYFKPHSPNMQLENGSSLPSDVQTQALRQAQSAYYLSVLIIQIWNLFACKARLRIPFGKFMFENPKTWLAVVFGTSFAFFIVYVPFMNTVFLTSSQLDPMILGVPMAFGAFIFGYSVARRLVLQKINPEKFNPELGRLNMATSEWSLGPSVDAGTAKAIPLPKA
ncbi:uncharacterized protein BJ171DRAFT_595368 [Polychytrium aggregatum]|uniref:uncharacterized protein n=1 Tax=Polychytrium aggregatum TaxID=110093 RepID=UPI0022FEDA44|nr:uncharacterized protein BJ171DRAFT_595368 [Polychytrium aggregatum]KAI9208928.1 hypothetical protein BJ171DRAFT_595368 [Polychytrium aggregatum]